MSTNSTVVNQEGAIAECVILVLLIILSLLLNGGVMVVYAYSKTLRASKHNVFIVNLMLYDFVYVVIVMPVSLRHTICQVVPCSQTGEDIVCKITGYLSSVSSMVGSVTLMFIAVDRYLATAYPLSYVTKISKTKCLVAAAFSWLWGAVLSTPPLIPQFNMMYEYDYGIKHCAPPFRDKCALAWYTMVTGYFFPISIMSFCYYKIYRAIKYQKLKISSSNSQTYNTETRQRSTIHSDMPTTELTVNNDVTVGAGNTNERFHGKRKSASQTKRDNRIALRGAALILTFFICWSLYALTHLCHVTVVWPAWLNTTAIMFVYLICIFNPVVYVFNNTIFRAEASKLFYKKRCRRL